MLFNKFRIFITLLAAFAAFFAYFCRLNISLIIEEMVVRGDDDGGLSSSSSSSSGDVLLDEIDFLSREMAQMNSEDQARALLSTGPRWQQRRRLTTRQREAQRRISQQVRANINTALSIQEFNVNPSSSRENNTNTSQSVPSDNNLNEPSGNQTSTFVGHSQASGDNNNNNNTRNDHHQDDVRVEPAASDGGGGGEIHLLNWNKDDKNNILSAFFTGYVVLQIPAGRAAEIFGAKLLFLLLALGTGLGSLAFPVAAKCGHLWLAYACRVLIGASQAGLFPAVYVLLCEWLPRGERSSWLAVPSAMGRVGTIVMNLVVPQILLHFNWEMVFYVSGALMLAWGSLMLIFGSDSPATNRWISAEELNYIETRMEPQVGSLTKQPACSMTASGFTINEASSTGPDASHRPCKPPISWSRVLRNRPLWILTVVMFTSEWSNMLLLVKLAGFLGPALRMDISEIGFWSSVLVGVYCVHYPLSGVLASRMEAARWLDSSLQVRKLFEASAHLLQCLGCLVIAFTATKWLVLAALFLIMVGRSTVGGGQCLMPPELSKDYPGTVMAVANSLANSAGIIGPIVVSWLVERPDNYASWSNLWLLSAAIFATGGLVFCLLAENSPQNYCRKARGPRPAISQAQLFPTGGTSSSSSRRTRQPSLDSPGNPFASELEPEVLKIDAFSRVASEPPTSSSGGGKLHGKLV